jgi:hypothetical protein
MFCIVYVLFVCKCVLYYCHRVFVCKCVLYYCHRVTTQLQLTNILYHIIYLKLYILFWFTQWYYFIPNTNEVLQIQRFNVYHPMLHVSIQRIIIGHNMEKIKNP